MTIWQLMIDFVETLLSFDGFFKAMLQSRMFHEFLVKTQGHRNETVILLPEWQFDD